MNREPANAYAPPKLSPAVLVEEEGPLGSVPLPWIGVALRAAAPIWGFVGLMVLFTSFSEPDLGSAYVIVSFAEGALLLTMAAGFWQLHRSGRIAVTANVVMTIVFPLGIELATSGKDPWTYTWDDLVLYGLLAAGSLLLWRPRVTQLFVQKQSGSMFRKRPHRTWPGILGAALALLSSALFITTPEFTATALRNWGEHAGYSRLHTNTHHRSETPR